VLEAFVARGFYTIGALKTYNVPQKLDTELQNYRDGDIIKITNISSGGNRK
jgi:hypothetical protein